GGLLTVAGAVVIGLALPAFTRYRRSPDSAGSSAADISPEAASSPAAEISPAAHGSPERPCSEAPAAATGMRNLGSGDGSSQQNASAPPAVAIHNAGRMPITDPSKPPSSAPTGRVP